MVSYDQQIGENGIISVDMTAEAFGYKDGAMANQEPPTPKAMFLQAQQFILYGLVASAGIPECIAYSTAPRLKGPGTYRGNIMERAPQLAFTNHSELLILKEIIFFLSQRIVNRRRWFQTFGFVRAIPL
jgi:hypothetical protein